MYPLTTERLRIQPLGPADIDAFTAYRRDPDVARGQGWDTDYSIENAGSLIRTQPTTDIPRPGEWLQLAVHSPDGTTLFGDVAVHRMADQPWTFEVGVTFDRRYQGQGLAGEALRRLMELLFDQHEAHRVVAFCDSRNLPIGAVLRRLGFRLESHQIEADFFKGEWVTLDGYALLAREASSQN